MSHDDRISVLVDLVNNNEKNNPKLTQLQLSKLFNTSTRTIVRYVDRYKKVENNQL